MEIVYFVLGVVTVLLVIGCVVVVKVGTLVKELKEQVQFLERGSNDVANDIHRRIDDTERELQIQIKNSLDFIGDTKDVLHRRMDGQTTGSQITNREINSRIDSEMKDIYQRIDSVENEFYSQLDSRLDRLENKLIGKK